MKKAIAIGLIGLALASTRAAAQTAVEQVRILRDFEQSVVDTRSVITALTCSPRH